MVLRIAVVSRKGGVFKTGICCNLAVAAALRGKKAAIVDTDPQGSAAAWARRRHAPGVEVLASTGRRLEGTLTATKADVILIDTAPSVESDALAAAKAADLILVPCRAAALDLEAIGGTAQIIKLVRKPAFVVFTAVPPNASALEAEAKDVALSFGMRSAPVVLHQRAAFAHSAAGGQGVQEFEPNGKAAEEVAALARWCYGTSVLKH